MKYFVFAFLLLFLGGCLGEAWDATTAFFGWGTAPGDPSPAESLFGSIGPLLPAGIGTAALLLAKMVHGGIKIKKSLFEATGEAISNGSLVNAGTEEEVKTALFEAQQLHDNSKALAKAFEKHKNGDIIRKSIKKIKEFIPYFKE